MTARTPLRSAIIATRVIAAITSTISIGFFIAVITYIFEWYESRYPGLSVLPAGAVRAPFRPFPVSQKLIPL